MKENAQTGFIQTHSVKETVGIKFATRLSFTVPSVFSSEVVCEPVFSCAMSAVKSPAALKI